MNVRIRPSAEARWRFMFTSPLPLSNNHLFSSLDLLNFSPSLSLFFSFAYSFNSLVATCISQASVVV